MPDGKKKYSFGYADLEEDKNGWKTRHPKIAELQLNTLENIKKATREKNFVPSQINTPEKIQVGDTLTDAPRKREMDEVSKTMLKYLLAPAEGFTYGIKGAGNTFQESQQAFNEGDPLGGSLGVLSSLVQGAFSAATPFVPVLSGFTTGSKVASDIVGEDVVNTVMTPVETLTKPESLAGRSGAQIADLLLQGIVAGGFHKGLNKVRGKNIPKEIPFPKGTDSKQVFNIPPEGVGVEKLTDLETFKPKYELTRPVKEVTQEKLPSELIKESPRIKITPDEKGVGFELVKKDNRSDLRLEKKANNEYRVVSAESKKTGQGLGTEIYQKAIEYVQEQGGTFTSDISISESARRMYLGLKKKGFNVIENPNELKMNRGEKTYYSLNPEKPVFEIRGKDEILETTETPKQQTKKVKTTEPKKEDVQSNEVIEGQPKVEKQAYEFDLTKPEDIVKKNETDRLGINASISISGTPGSFNQVTKKIIDLTPAEVERYYSREFVEAKSSLTPSKKIIIDVPESKKETSKNLTSQQNIFENLQFTKETTGREKNKAIAQAKKDAQKLRTQGINAEIKRTKTGWGLYVDGVKQDKRSLGLVERAEKKSIDELPIKNEAKESFEKLPQDVVDRQTIIAEELLKADDLPSGYGDKVLQKGLSDIKEDAGKELSPEAKIVRQSAEEVLENGTIKNDIKGNLKQKISSDEIKDYVDKRIEEKAVKEETGDTSFELTSPDTTPKSTEVKPVDSGLGKKTERIISDEKYKQAKDRLTGKSNFTASMMNDPIQGAKVLKDLTTVGAYHFENGLRKFADWSRKMIEEFGDKIRPRLRELWNSSKEGYDLIGLHNLSPEKLFKADELGGLPVPSIAITKKNIPYTNFGDVSLIANQKLIDPRIKTNKVFDADIYSPRVPQATLIVSNEKMKPYANKLKSLIETKYKKDKSRLVERFNESKYPENSLAQSIKDGNLRYDERMELLFIAEKHPELLPKKIDYDSIKEPLKKYQSEYEEFIANIEKDAITDKKLFKGFSYSGNRIYQRYTMDNVLREMKKELRGGENFFYGAGSVRAQNAIKFKNVKEIVKEKDRLVNDKEMEKTKDYFNDELSELMGNAAENYKGEYSNPRQEFEYVIVDAAKSYNPKSVLEKNGFGDMDIPRVEKFLDDLRKAPTQYFESKVQKPVGLNEFDGAVIPSDASPKVRQTLKENGIKRIRTYERGNEQSRVNAIDQFTESTFGRFVSQSAYEKAKKNIIIKGQGINPSGIDPTILKDYAVIGSYHLETVIRTGISKGKEFKGWAKEMISDLGDEVRPHLRDIWKEVQKDTELVSRLYPKKEDVSKPVSKSVSLTPELTPEGKTTGIKNAVVNQGENVWQNWLNNQPDVEFIKRKVVGVNQKGQQGAAFTQKTDKGYKVIYSDFTPDISLAKEVGRVLSHQIPREKIKIFNDEANKLGISGDNFKDRFSEAVKTLAGDPYLIKTAPEISKFLRSKDVVIGRVGSEIKSDIPILPKNLTDRKKISEKFKSETQGKSHYKSLSKFTNDVELNEYFSKVGENAEKPRGIMKREAVEELAAELGISQKDILGLKQGDIRNVEQVTGMRQVVIDNTNELMKFVKDNDVLTTEKAEQLKNMYLTNRLMISKVMGLTSEAGRVLQSLNRKMDAREFDLLNEIYDKLQKSGVKDIESPLEFNKKVKKILDPTIADKAVYWWYNSLLANPLTDVANVIGNSSYLGSELISRSLWEPQNTAKVFKGIGAGWKDFTKDVKDIWNAEQQQIAKYDFDTNTLRKNYDPNPNSVQNILLKNILKGGRILLPINRLRVEDALFRNIAKNIEREVGIKNLSKKYKESNNTVRNSLIEIENSIKNETLKKDLTDREKSYLEMIDNYNSYAQDLTFTHQLGKTGQLFQKTTNSHAFLKWLFPFIRISVNLTKEGLKQTPYYVGKSIIKEGLGKLTKKEYADSFSNLSPRQKNTMLRRAIIGSSAIAGLTHLISKGGIEVTGDGPKNKKQKDEWIATGYKPNHIYFGDKGIPYQNVNPYGILLSIIGNVSDQQKYDTKFNDEDNSIDEKISLLTGKLANTFMDQSFMWGLETLYKSIEYGDTNLMSKILTSPLPNIGGIIRGFKGDFKRYKMESIGDVINYKLGLSELGLMDDLEIDETKGESPYRRFPFQVSEKSGVYKKSQIDILQDEVNSLRKTALETRKKEDIKKFREANKELIKLRNSSKEYQDLLKERRKKRLNNKI